MRFVHHPFFYGLLCCLLFLSQPVLADQEPVVQDLTKTLKEDKKATLTLKGQSPVHKKITYSLSQPPQHGTVTIKGKQATATYTPEANYFGTDAFQYQASDGTLNSASGTVNLTIQPVNDAPVATAQSFSLPMGESSNMVLSGSDPEADPLNYSISTKPQKGKIVINGNIATYTPNKTSFQGKDRFWFRVKDGKKYSKPARVDLTLGSVVVIANVTPLSGLVGQSLDIMITGNNLPLTIVLGISGQSVPCSIMQREPSTAQFNCSLDNAGAWDLIILSNSTLNGGEPIPTGFTGFTVNANTKPNTPTGKLNDTGITTCSNADTDGLPCPVPGFPGQDAEHGRDATHQNDNDGHAGFSFTKISSTGKELPANATKWDCVKDNVTGLMWEVKTDDGGLRDMDNTYTWYEPDNSKNAGDAGIQNGGTCTGSACDTYSYVQAINHQTLCGKNAWRVPIMDELLSILSLDRNHPAIDTAYFPNFPSTFACYENSPNCFWSSSLFASDTTDVWSINFENGYTGWGSKFISFQVLLVQSE